MRIQCKGCRVEFNVADEKIPEDKPLKTLCPRCKSPLEILGRNGPAEAEKSPFCLSEQNPADPLLDYANAIDVVDQGVRTALLCDTDLKRGQRIVQVLQELDFWVIHALRPAFALGKLHHNSYDLLVLDENFNSEKESENLVLHHIQLLPMHQRRQFYLCLLSREKTSMDAKLAFRIGVNLILNVNDLDKAKVLFARLIKEHRNFYALFNAELSKKDCQTGR
ncbi:MAG: zinc-ribbon domain-containing protein [Syntrophobacteraceae bacterium]|nr:zinc-ribbon domain-containing protein [Syntrophobacteraceae bacterium]